MQILEFVENVGLKLGKQLGYNESFVFESPNIGKERNFAWRSRSDLNHGHESSCYKAFGRVLHFLLISPFEASGCTFFK